MQQDGEERLAKAVKVLVRQDASISRAFAVLSLAAAVIVGILFTPKILAVKAQPDNVIPMLRVRGLVVYDENGIDRVRIGAGAPAPSVLGKRMKRGAPFSGILLMDGDGNERGGIGTNDATGEAGISVNSVVAPAGGFLTTATGSGRLKLENRSHAFHASATPPHVELQQAGNKIFELPSRGER